MFISLTEVETLCTPAERELVLSSRDPHVGELTGGELKQNADRARKLWLKWLAQSRKQVHLASDKDRHLADGKLAVFREALDQFESHLSQQDLATSRKEPTQAERARHDAQAVTEPAGGPEAPASRRPAQDDARAHGRTDWAQRSRELAAADEAHRAQDAMAGRHLPYAPAAGHRSQTRRDGKR